MIEGGELATVLETPKEAVLCLVEDAGERTCACLTAIGHVGGCEGDVSLAGHCSVLSVKYITVVY